MLVQFFFFLWKETLGACNGFLLLRFIPYLEVRVVFFLSPSLNELPYDFVWACQL
jgi:hypothetical protein